MRLPWPFGRRSSPEAPAADGGSARPATVDPAQPALAPPTGAWSSLPAIQRTIGEVPVVAPPGPFLAEVSGARPLPPIIEPLGHEVSPLAPAGQVVAHARPVASLTSRMALPRRPVQTSPVRPIIRTCRPPRRLRPRRQRSRRSPPSHSPTRSAGSPRCRPPGRRRRPCDPSRARRSRG
jgi:hypothetical protein